MKVQQLIYEASLQLKKSGEYREGINTGLFYKGAWWMHRHLQQLRGSNHSFNTTANYTGYGLLKYGVSLAAFFVAAYGFYQKALLLALLAIPVFYLVEVHFLFLYPLLLDDAAQPVRQSIQLSYKAGILKCTITTMLIGIFMLTGMLNLKHPLRNWQIGCIAILIWYRHEIRDRI